MKILKIGSNSGEVKKVQEKLKALGFYLAKVDGAYGPISEQAVKDFQKKYFVTGEVDPVTQSRLDQAYKSFLEKPKNCPELSDLGIKKFHLKPSEYIHEKTEKVNITLHLTAGGPNGHWTKSTWEGDSYFNGYSVGTSYVICGRDDFKRNPAFATKDGQILELFPHENWAHHVNLISAHNKHNLGIEICNYGYLTEMQEGIFVTTTGKVIPESEVVELEYRGLRYWHKISEAQLEATFNLIKALTKQYPKIAGAIKDQTFDESWADYNPSLVAGKTHGVFPHTAWVSPHLKHRFDMPPFKEVLGMLKAL